MKWRLMSMAFLVAAISTGLTWLSLQPLLLRLVDWVRRLAPPGSPALESVAQIRTLLPFLLALDLLALSLLTFFILDLVLGRPLRHTEAAVEGLGRLELEQPLAGGGPLLSRVQSALARMAEALRAERSVTRSQLHELQSANARLALAQTELISSERLAVAGRLAAGVAHEVGNPLAGVLGYLSVVRSRVAGQGEVQGYLDHIEAEVQRIDGIVRGLLDLGRAAELKPVLMELEPLVRSCVALVRAGAEFKGIQLHLELAPAVARVDPAALTQVLINLMLNAAQALGGRGNVWVRLQRTADSIVLDVEDDGPGIPPEVMPRIFEPFFTTKASGKGTGLGLAISQRLVVTQGGRLSAGARPGGGARLSVQLPAP